MAVENVDAHDLWAATAGAALKANTLVAFNGEGKIVAAKAGERCFVLRNEPEAAGESAEICLPGPQTKAVAGGAITAGELVASNAEGKLVKAETGNEIVGTALESGASGDIISITSHPAGAKA